MEIRKKTKEIKQKILIIAKNNDYIKKYKKFSFNINKEKYKDYEQYEAVITRLYHTVEKSLAFSNFKPGHGINNIKLLIQVMKNYYKDGFDVNKTFFKCSLAALEAYIKKNEENNFFNNEIYNEIKNLPGTSNKLGGTIQFKPLSENEIKKLNYEEFIKSRHSIRHFSHKKIDLNILNNVLELAQYTPSACNRQGWKTCIISDKKVIKDVLKNQNGNEGFGNEFDKLLLILGDLRYFNKDRELYQVYIDGGMYAQSIINSLHFYHIGSVPLSASLTLKQEKNIRKILSLNEAETFIMFIGIGNYPDECITTLSARREINTKII